MTFKIGDRVQVNAPHRGSHHELGTVKELFRGRWLVTLDETPTKSSLEILYSSQDLVHLLPAKNPCQEVPREGIQSTEIPLIPCSFCGAPTKDVPHTAPSLFKLRLCQPCLQDLAHKNRLEAEAMEREEEAREEPLPSRLKKTLEYAAAVLGGIGLGLIGHFLLP